MGRIVKLLRFTCVLMLSCARVFNRKICCVCGRTVYGFLPYRFNFYNGRLAYFGGLDLVGSDLKNFSCPFCASHDRERHLLLYMRESGVMRKIRGARVLHMAPEKNLSRIIRNENPALYVQGDMFPPSPDVEKIDLRKIPYSDGSFDVLIANHVMEHVNDDRSALREIFRVLAPAGVAILQTPYSSKLEKTFEDPGIDGDELRLAFYGQEDHVRLYGKDIFSRFSSEGLRCDLVCHYEILSRFPPNKFGLNEDEPFFLFTKAN